jgi:hypothetical protein
MGRAFLGSSEHIEAKCGQERKRQNGKTASRRGVGWAKGGRREMEIERTGERTGKAV